MAPVAAKRILKAAHVRDGLDAHRKCLQVRLLTAYPSWHMPQAPAGDPPLRPAAICVRAICQTCSAPSWTEQLRHIRSSIHAAVDSRRSH
jgi:hypothetical protein